MSLDPTINEQLTKCRHEHGGRLNSDEVIEFSRRNPQLRELYESFEWDDGKCGEAYRRIQARRLITRYRPETVTVNVNPRSKYEGSWVVPMQSAPHTYVPIPDADVSDVLAHIRQYLAQCVGSLEAITVRVQESTLSGDDKIGKYVRSADRCRSQFQSFIDEIDGRAAATENVA